MEEQSVELRARLSSVNIEVYQQPAPHRVESNAEFSLPRADGGRQAWLLLAGAFVMEALVWGMVFSFGIFQEHYTNDELFHGQEAQIPLIGTIASGLVYMCSPIALPMFRQFPHRRRQVMVAGVVVVCAAFIGASFANSVAALIATQGVLFGIGASMMYYPVFLFIDEWFVQRKGFAYGIAWASSGLSGLVFPYVLSWLLGEYGFRTTLRVLAILNLALILPVLPVLKPRLPPSMVTRAYQPRLAFAAKPLFLAFTIANLIEATGFFLPGIYLPSYARSIGLSNTVATSTVSLLNVGAFLGFITGGVLTDRWSTKGVVLFSTAGGTLALALMWGFSSTAVLLVIFSFCYGFFGATFVTAWPGIIKEVVRKDPTQTAESSTCYAFFVAGRGIGSIASGPLSQALLRLPKLTGAFSYGYGSMYGSLIVFAIGTTVLGGLGSACEIAGLI